MNEKKKILSPSKVLWQFAITTRYFLKTIVSSCQEIKRDPRHIALTNRKNVCNVNVQMQLKRKAHVCVIQAHVHIIQAHEREGVPKHLNHSN